MEFKVSLDYIVKSILEKKLRNGSHSDVQLMMITD